MVHKGLNPYRWGSVLSSIYLYTEGGDAPGWPGAKSEHIGNIRAIRNAARRDAALA